MNPDAASNLNSNSNSRDLNLDALVKSHDDGDMPQQEGMNKVVLARRTRMAVQGPLDPLQLLSGLQERDPRAYQLYLQPPGGGAFLGSTPERLYARTGPCLASEAVAGTRPRGPGGDVEQDFWLGLDLLKSKKDHVEFTMVRHPDVFPRPSLRSPKLGLSLNGILEMLVHNTLDTLDA